MLQKRVKLHILPLF